MMLAGAAVACVLVALYEHTQIAKIVNDEADWDLRDASPQMKVIIVNDGEVARYVSEDATTYLGEIQDTFRIRKEIAEVETWYASDGKGVVFLKEPGSQLAYASADTLSCAVGVLKYEEGSVPETYNVYNFKDGWFCIEIDGDAGYVNEMYVNWDALSSF